MINVGDFCVGYALGLVVDEMQFLGEVRYTWKTSSLWDLEISTSGTLAGVIY